MDSTGMNDRTFECWVSPNRERSPEFLALLARVAATNKPPEDIKKCAADLAADVAGLSD